MGKLSNGQFCFTEHMMEPKTHAISRDSSEVRGLASGMVLSVEGL